MRLPAADNSQELITTTSTYSPWNADERFMAVYNFITPQYTMVDKYRLYELWKLVEQSSKLDKGSILEVGVWRGGTGVVLAQQAKNCGINDCVYLCDTFKGVVKAGRNDIFYSNGECSNTSKETAQDLMRKLNIRNVEICQGTFPDDFDDKFGKLQYRLCHIDVDVYQGAKEITEWVWPRLVKGGIIVYDDYGTYSTVGVTKYVDEIMSDKDKIVIYNINGHAVLVKL